ncbi:MAG: 16S rRNA (cytosine(1402)-N(4))-methyltransferase RsmH [Parachlamydiales bacterium]|nr:16S rRNA (cytosine(1402)-N(4))-methyltransferase RsmH [Parachlamydiales bacterium]
MSHVPVLKNEILQHLKKKVIHIVFDGTVGAGGHAAAILSEHPEIERYIGCDQDPGALEIAQKSLALWKDKVELVYGNFSHVDHFLKERNIGCLDVFLIDVGVSSMQLSGERGFSFQKESPLDMRMDPNGPLTAKMILNTFSQKELERIFLEYGEERNYRKIAKAIVSKRSVKPFSTTKELAELVSTINKKGKIHPATRVFQALRIAVNEELTMLQEGLKKAIDKLCQGGIIGCISFHSLEDRIVKTFFREKKVEGMLELITKKPIVASPGEKRDNPRSRSAKLRLAQRIAS